jgi:hypothetical protein
MSNLEATILSEQFGAQFNYDYAAFGNLPEPMVIGDQSGYLTLTDSDLQLSNPLEIEFWYYYADTQNWTDSIGLFEIQNSATNFLKMAIANNSTTLFIDSRVNNVADSDTWVGFFDTVPGWYKIKLTWSGTYLKIYRNDILFDTKVYTDLNNMVAAGATLRIMNTLAGDEPVPAGHSLFHWKYTLNSILIAHYPICEESGNIAYDVTGNGLHLTGVSYNALTWTRTNDSEYYLGVYGYRLSGAVYIPSLLDQTAAADGNALTNVPPNTDFN